MPNADVVRFRSRDPRAPATMVQRVLTDDEPRRLVAEASAHVLRFDWSDVAQRTAQL